MQYTIRDWLSDQLDWIIPAAFVVCLFVALFGGFISFAMYADRKSCHATAEAMDVNWSWGVWQPCMIVVDGKSIPLSAYKVVKVAH